MTEPRRADPSAVRAAESRSGRVGLFHGWPVRRWWLLAGVLLPFGLVFAAVGPSLRVWWALPVAVVSAGLAGVVVASYLAAPGSGRWLDPGCSSCAPLGAASVLGSLLMRDLVPGEPRGSVLAIGLLAFGLAHRLTSGSACNIPAGEPDGGNGPAG